MLVLGLTDHFLAIGGGFSDFLSFEVSAEGADHVHVKPSDVVVVVVDVLVLLVVLSLKLLDCFVFLGLNLGNLCFALGLHVFSKARHFGLVLLLNLVCDALVLLPLLSRQLVVVLMQGILVLGLAHILLLLLDFEGAQVLFEFALLDTVLIL